MSGESEGQALMEAAVEVARLAGGIALGYQRSGLRVETKADGSPVTVADRAAEQGAREWIEARFPRDGVLGEEMGVVRPDARRRWILDPIDGTKSFVRGVPLWGTLVAIAEGDDVLAGAAFFPAVDEIVAAAPGLGAWWNGERCTVSDVATIDAATVLTTDDRFPGDTVRRKAWHDMAAGASVSRTWGDCYGYMLVATGRAEVMVDDVLSAWDAAAVMPIIQEAGGVFTDWTGAATAFGGSAIATNAAISSRVRGILVGSPDRTPAGA